jgi:hypothetical protein
MSAVKDRAAAIRELAASLDVTVTATMGALAAVTTSAPCPPGGREQAEAACGQVLARFPMTAPTGWSGTASPAGGRLVMSKGGVDRRLARQFTGST